MGGGTLTLRDGSRHRRQRSSRGPGGGRSCPGVVYERFTRSRGLFGSGVGWTVGESRFRTAGSFTGPTPAHDTLRSGPTVSVPRVSGGFLTLRNEFLWFVPLSRPQDVRETETGESLRCPTESRTAPEPVGVSDSSVTTSTSLESHFNYLRRFSHVREWMSPTRQTTGRMDRHNPLLLKVH